MKRKFDLDNTLFHTTKVDVLDTKKTRLVALASTTLVVAHATLDKA